MSYVIVQTTMIHHLMNFMVDVVGIIHVVSAVTVST